MKYDLQNEGPKIVWFTWSRDIANKMLAHVENYPFPKAPEPIELGEPFNGKYFVTDVEWATNRNASYPSGFIAAITFVPLLEAGPK